MAAWQSPVGEAEDIGVEACKMDLQQVRTPGLGLPGALRSKALGLAIGSTNMGRPAAYNELSGRWFLSEG
jgi:hypothetical protein